ncbi:YdjY domain-containing protein [Miniphocaeibacter massiliensis]|uniref:YdjY domain-containing protein n=1 Tax=Miniphocaeibacter massiliensis TaxID=2041841 RepID=UPI000C07894A|nr:YdjY domain-containing protein [Miniphocaeibacter massiliensis]
MKLRKFGIIMAMILLITTISACSNKDNNKDTKQNSSTESSQKNSTELSEKNPMIVDKDNKEIKMLCEVNGTYFTEPTRHGIVYKGGSAGEKAILRGLGDEKEFHQAWIDFGAKGGNNLTDKDMSVKPEDAKSIEGEKVEAFIEWDNQEQIPFSDIVKATEEKPMDLRFGGNIEGAKKHNTGCILCLDSCSAGILSDATWPGGAMANDLVKFYGDENVLPKDGTKVIVTFKLAE